MALFKILRGNEANLPSTKTDGYAYFTQDTNNFYIDTSSSERKLLGIGKNTPEGGVTIGKSDLKAINSNAVAEGKETIAQGEASHAEGHGVFGTKQTVSIAGITVNIGNFISTKNITIKSVSGNTLVIQSNDLGTILDNITEDEIKHFVLNVNNILVPIKDYTISGILIKTITLTCFQDAAQLGVAAGNRVLDLYLGTALGKYSHHEGSRNLTLGNASHAEGEINIAKGHGSHAEGRNTKAYGEDSHTEGVGTVANGNYSHAEGEHTQATAQGAHAEGQSTQATSSGAHAEGQSTIAQGSASHAEGVGSKATALAAHAQGYYTEANGNGSFSTGKGTVAQNHYSTARGKYNLIDNNHAYADIVGWGDDENHRKNIHTLDTNGDAWFAGKITVGENKQELAKLYQGSGEGSVRQINATTASGKDSFAEGYLTMATGHGAHAEGYSTKATSLGAHAEGFKSYARGYASHAEGGEGTAAEGSYSHAEGYNTYTDTNSVGAHAEGHTSKAYGRVSHAEGNQTTAYFPNSHTEGNRTKTLQKIYGFIPRAQDLTNKTVTINNVGIDFEKGSTYIIYYGSTNNFIAGRIASEEDILSSDHGDQINLPLDQRVDFTTLFGSDYFSWTDDSKRQLTNGCIIIQGGITGEVEVATGGVEITAHAEGNLTEVGLNSHVEGYLSTAYGPGSHSEGYKSYAQGPYTHAEGIHVTAQGVGSHAEGHETETYGQYSHAEGETTQVNPGSIGGHAEGYATLVDYNAPGGHAEGYSTTVEKNASGGHAEGCSTIAYGAGSHAEGQSTQAQGIASHAEGYGTVASGDYQHVSGKYNAYTAFHNYAVVVGNGTEEQHSNAYTLDWDGNGWFAGDIRLNDQYGNPQRVPVIRYGNQQVIPGSTELRTGDIYICYI